MTDDFGQVLFFPLPYADPARVRDLLGGELSGHDEAMGQLVAQILAVHPSGSRSVLVGHCFLAGAEVCDSERPLSIGGADQVSLEHFTSFDYVALGHLHGPQSRGAQQIRYSGSPLKYSFSEERQRKSVTLVDLGPPGEVAIETVPLTPLRDMRTLEGSLEELLAAGRSDPHAQDYLAVRLTDKHAILDVMSKLRDVYPNVLHLERPGLMARGQAMAASRERLQKGELAMFRDFFRQVTGDELSDAQTRLVADCIDRLHREED